jgi:Xaa-Pro aminopeptidase
LYYPEDGLGVRLEDTWYVRPDGGLEVLADYPMDLVLPLRPSA